MRADLCSVKGADIDVAVKGTPIVELGTGGDDDEDSKVADIDVSVKCTSIVELGTEGDEDENSMVEALVGRMSVAAASGTSHLAPGDNSGEWQLASGLASGNGYGSRLGMPASASTLDGLRGRRDDGDAW